MKKICFLQHFKIDFTLSHKNGTNWYSDIIFCLLFTQCKLYIARTNNIKGKKYNIADVPIQKIIFVPKWSSPHKSKIIEILITVLKPFSSDQIADMDCARIFVQAVFGIKTLKTHFWQRLTVKKPYFCELLSITRKKLEKFNILVFTVSCKGSQYNFT